MNPRYFTAIVLAVMLVVIYCQIKSREGFESKREKASFITNWFQNNTKPSYSNYKDEVPHSDIVEYSKIKKMSNYGSLNPGAVASVL